MKRPKNAETRTPIKGDINRQAGQSARDWLNDFVSDQALLAVLPLGIMLFWLWIELINRYSRKPISLWLIGFLLILSAINFVWRFHRLRRHAKLMRQGLDGELYVAQIIERDLIPQGYRAFHDVVFDKGERKFNIDHLIVGPKGVFCIETKNWSKPMKGETVATFDGKFIYLNGKATQCNAVGQACALAKEASTLIKGLTGLTIDVIPVVVTIGWYVRKICVGRPKVLVVNEEALAVFVENYPGNMSKASIDLIVQKIGVTNLAKG